MFTPSRPPAARRLTLFPPTRSSSPRSAWSRSRCTRTPGPTGPARSGPVAGSWPATNPASGCPSWEACGGREPVSATGRCARLIPPADLLRTQPARSRGDRPARHPRAAQAPPPPAARPARAPPPARRRVRGGGAGACASGPARAGAPTCGRRCRGCASRACPVCSSRRRSSDAASGAEAGARSQRPPGSRPPPRSGGRGLESLPGPTSPSPAPARSSDSCLRHSRSRHCGAAEVSRGLPSRGSRDHRDAEARGAR